jgi:NYN domain
MPKTLVLIDAENVGISAMKHQRRRINWPVLANELRNFYGVNTVVHCFACVEPSDLQRSYTLLKRDCHFEPHLRPIQRKLHRDGTRQIFANSDSQIAAEAGYLIARLRPNDELVLMTGDGELATTIAALAKNQQSAAIKVTAIAVQGAMSQSISSSGYFDSVQFLSTSTMELTK